MGVYIEGLKRPEPVKDCTHRNFVDVRIFDDGTATIKTDESPFFKVYKVKSVPPHGGLIDESEKVDAHYYNDKFGKWSIKTKTVGEVLAERCEVSPKIVIPAEK